MICDANKIEHRLTKPNHPWSHENQKTVRGTVFLNGGQVERMNRTIKEATVKRYHYDSHEQLRRHLDLFIDAYNHARRLKTLKGLTPVQFIWKEWQATPDLFYEEPCHLTVGPYMSVNFLPLSVGTCGCRSGRRVSGRAKIGGCWRRSWIYRCG